MQGTKAFVMSANDQMRMTTLFTNFSKSEPNALKYSQVINLLLDRCVFNTKFTLTDFQPLFEACLKVKAVKPHDKTQVQGEKIINKEQLIFLLNEAAQILYKPDPNYLQRFYQMFLTQKIELRVMLVDDLAKKLIVEDFIKQLCLYSEQIKHIFISYQIENYWSVKRNKRLLLSFRQILLQNKKWSYISLILFLKQSETTPHLVTVQHIEQFLRTIIPNNNTKQQYDFYSKHVLSESYHKDLDGGDGQIHPGDPGIMLFELQLILLRLAWDTFPKEQEKKDVGMVLQRYLKYLYLRKNSEFTTTPLPNITRKMINKMKEYYKVINNEYDKEDVQKNPQEESLTPFQKLAMKMQKELVNAPSLGLDFPDLLKMLDRQLPKMPPVPAIQPEYTGKYDKNFAITLGKQPPPQPVQKEQKPGKAEKKDAGKKDEVPPREFKWAEVPQVKQTTQDYLKQINDKLNFQVKPLTDISRGTINRQGFPALIGEILFPPELPKAVVPYLQAANNALLDRNFMLAIQNFNNGANAWKKSTVEFDSVAELFFQYSKGNIYLAAGRLEYALQAFLISKKHVEGSKLPFTNPDRSLPYYGIGQVLYQMEEYQLAARSFLKSREIRESVLGLQHVQTASVFNNLGCCFFMLGRSQQALGYIQIAEVVLDTELGPHHERTMTSRYNLKKITRGTFENKPAFRKFWEVFEQDLFEKKKKKKKDDGGKKGKK